MMEEEKSSKEKIAETIEKLKERKIIISRVPKPTKEKFEQFAKEHYDDDYGFALKYLIDTVIGSPITSEEYKELHIKIDILIDRLIKLEAKILELDNKPE